MKHTKAIFLIVLGAFLMATGFAFAAESETYNRLASGGDPFGGSRASEITPVNLPAPTLSKAAPAVPAPTEVKPSEQPRAAAAPAAAAEPKKSVGDSVKEFLGKNRRNILLGGIGAYLGWALIGTMAGALTGGLFFLAFFWLAAL